MWYCTLSEHELLGIHLILYQRPKLELHDSELVNDNWKRVPQILLTIRRHWGISTMAHGAFTHLIITKNNVEIKAIFDSLIKTSMWRLAIIYKFGVHDDLMFPSFSLVNASTVFPN